jgi:hypothetical protein
MVPGAGSVAAVEDARRMSAPQGPPQYKGEPLDAERGPGLGCFWLQVIVLGVLLVLTPLTVVWAWPAWVSAALLILTLVLLLFAGQTVIFLLRLVAADRRSRRTPQSPTARKTVGMLEDEASARGEAGTPAASSPPAVDGSDDARPAAPATADESDEAPRP